MYNLFVICFGIGVGYTVIGFILGEVIGLFDFDHDLSIDGSVSPLKPSVIASFLTVFGGSGLIFYRQTIGVLALIYAFAVGLFVAFIFYRFIIVPLYNAQNTSAVEIQSLIGHECVVTETIVQGGYGKITYFVHGNTYSAPTKSLDGDRIEKNDKVVIVHIENNTYFVRRKI